MIEKLERRYIGPDTGCGGATFSDVIDKINEIVDVLNSDSSTEEHGTIYTEEGQVFASPQSEDERIRKALIDGVRQIRCKNGITQEQMIAYLEKQKEQKPELVQHPPITYTYPSDASRDEQLKLALIALLNNDLIQVRGSKFTKQDLIEWVERIPTDKPAEWSEKDEKLLNYAISMTDDAQVKNFLKSLRPSWKPSEEQMESLLWCTAHLGGADRRVLAELYEHLKKYCL